MKVAIIDQSNFAVPYDAALCDGLANAGLDVTLFARPARAAESLPTSTLFRTELFFSRQSSKAWAEALPTPIRGAIKAVEYLFDLLRFERRELHEFDVIHIQWSILPIVERLFFPRWSRKRRLVMTIHDTVPFLDNPTSTFQLYGWNALIHSMPDLIVHTEQGRKAIRDYGIADDRCHVIPHGVIFGETPADAAPATRTNDEPVILLFGHLKPYKGTFELLEAVRLIVAETSARLKLVIAGKLYIDEEELRRAIRDKGLESIVELKAGFLPDEALDTLLRLSDIVAFPYTMVEASGALLKTLPFGNAILATKVGVFAEILSDEVDAILIDDNEPETVAAGLRKLLGNPELRQAVGTGAVSLSKSLVTWDDIALQTRDIYRKDA